MEKNIYIFSESSSSNEIEGFHCAHERDSLQNFVVELILFVASTVVPLNGRRLFLFFY